jgi:hypothetical protein
MALEILRVRTALSTASSAAIPNSSSALPKPFTGTSTVTIASKQPAACSCARFSISPFPASSWIRVKTGVMTLWYSPKASLQYSRTSAQPDSHDQLLQFRHDGIACGSSVPTDCGMQVIATRTHFSVAHGFQVSRLRSPKPSDTGMCITICYQRFPSLFADGILAVRRNPIFTARVNQWS